MILTARAPAEIAQAAQLAAVLEVSAAKPGNVGPEHRFRDAGYEDFLRSALAIGPAMADAVHAGVGATILRAVADTRRVVGANTNLGIILLFAPLARAAAEGTGELRSRLHRTLAALSVADAEAAYEGIRLASPGGLGQVPEQDVRDTPTVTLRAAMALAAPRDAIAREYMSDYAITFGIGEPALERAVAGGASLRAAATEAFLRILARVPDTLIARKCGVEMARRVSQRAAEVLEAGPPDTPERRIALTELDIALRGRHNALNPGSTADLTAAALFVRLLEHNSGEQE